MTNCSVCVYVCVCMSFCLFVCVCVCVSEGEWGIMTYFDDRWGWHLKGGFNTWQRWKKTKQSKVACVPWGDPLPDAAHCLPRSAPLSCEASAPFAGTGWSVNNKSSSSSSPLWPLLAWLLSWQVQGWSVNNKSSSSSSSSSPLWPLLAWLLSWQVQVDLSTTNHHHHHHHHCDQYLHGYSHDRYRLICQWPVIIIITTTVTITCMVTLMTGTCWSVSDQSSSSSPPLWLFAWLLSWQVQVDLSVTSHHHHHHHCDHYLHGYSHDRYRLICQWPVITIIITTITIVSMVTLMTGTGWSSQSQSSQSWLHSWRA